MKRLPLYVKRTKKSTLSEVTGAGIQAAYGNNMIIWFATDDAERRMVLYADRRVLVAVLRKLLNAIDLPSNADNRGANELSPAAQATIDDWEWLTPQMVIDKFRESPNLRPLLPEVIKVLSPQIITESEDNDIKKVTAVLSHSDIFDNGKLKRGAKSKVAKILGVRYAGNYRTRVDRVIDRIAA